MGIFHELRMELPPFDLYLKQLFKKKVMPLVAEPTNRAIPFSKLRRELFHPKSETNQQTTEMATEMGATSGQSLLKELRDQTKATAAHLSSAGGRFSWGETSESEREAGVGMMAVNNSIIQQRDRLEA
eukprot:scaffold164632_cov35-Attheya_sp.AAC.1